MKLGYLGLGKMGYNMVARLKERGHEIVGFDPSEEARARTAELDVMVVDSYTDVVAALEAPRIIWSMVPHAAVDDMLKEIVPLLAPGDLIVEAANSPYEETVRRAKEVESTGVHFLEMGVSGGPGGARNGACLMIGGEKGDYERLLPLVKDVAKGEGYYARLGPAGAGHYAKMIHNGIEYGMMQAIGEGFALLKNAPFQYNLFDVCDIYNRGSVIESRLISWARSGYEQYGEELETISPTIGHSGEGEWTVKEARRQGVDVPIIEGSYQYRVHSVEKPHYIGRVVNMLRNQFGGHSIRPNEQPGHSPYGQ